MSSIGPTFFRTNSGFFLLSFISFSNYYQFPVVIHQSAGYIPAHMSENSVGKEYSQCFETVYTCSEINPSIHIELINYHFVMKLFYVFFFHCVPSWYN